MDRRRWRISAILFQLFARRGCRNRWSRRLGCSRGSRRRRLRRGGRDRTGRHHFFRAQILHHKRHRMLDRDAGDAFRLVDPTVAVLRLAPFFSGSFQLFQSRPRPVLFVRRAARHRDESDPNHASKKHEERYRPQPRREQKTRLLRMRKGIFLVRHVSWSGGATRTGADRGKGRARSCPRVGDKKTRECRQFR